jgi:magnesium-transporting ATPase (P-type)
MQEDKNFYNIIAYSSMTIAIIFGTIHITNSFNNFLVLNPEQKFTFNLLIVGLISLYYKLHTTPITEAISHYWKYKVLKQDKTTNNNEDYASFKDNQNENNPT